jgi:uncharacterized protein involved in exopolysaccharide biosynthesis
MSGNRVLRRLLANVPAVSPNVRRLRRELTTTRRTAVEALRLATESARAVESLLQSEIELKRELAVLRPGAPRSGSRGSAESERAR